MENSTSRNGRLTGGVFTFELFAEYLFGDTYWVSILIIERKMIAAFY